jgi:hypothetical protein
MSKQTELVGLARTTNLDEVNAAYSAGSLSNRNLIINGAMQVAQRGTSKAGVTTIGYHSVDRWLSNLSVAGTWTISQEADAPTGFSKSLKYLCTTAGAGDPVGQHAQVIEGQNLQHLNYGTASAIEVTVGFWVKSNVVGTHVCRLYNPNGTARLIAKQYTITTSGAWEYKTITFAGDEIRNIPDDANYGLNIAWWFAAGSTFNSGSPSDVWQDYVTANEAPNQVDVSASVGNYWQITGVQLEVGDTATPFEHRSYGQELTLCQRYYQVFKEDGVTTTFGSAIAYNTTAAYDGPKHIFPVEMRAVPTRSESGSGTAGRWLRNLYSDNIFNS